LWNKTESGVFFTTHCMCVYFVPFLRYSQILAQSCKILISYLYLTPCRGILLWCFVWELTDRPRDIAACTDHNPRDHHMIYNQLCKKPISTKMVCLLKLNRCNQILLKYKMKLPSMCRTLNYGFGFRAIFDNSLVHSETLGQAVRQDTQVVWCLMDFQHKKAISCHVKSKSLLKILITV